ncbi:superoxide reductase [Parelusimicrobium proximum]|uniref:desulfoferrodoxin family protein n=1 Tax=Parelusimicrobium proximum TaxID=3228953 RepID=UPI003D16FB3D
MAKEREIYKSADGKLLVEVLLDGEGNLQCDGKDMVLQTENTVDAAKEKHVPVIEKVENGYNVKIGSVPHPMIPEHYIQMIELVCIECGKVQRKLLFPGNAPEAFFCTRSINVVAREYCNLHGLWTAKNH